MKAFTVLAAILASASGRSVQGRAGNESLGIVGGNFASRNEFPWQVSLQVSTHIPSPDCTSSAVRNLVD